MIPGLGAWRDRPIAHQMIAAGKPMAFDSPGGREILK
jgi:hypothetical protein